MVKPNDSERIAALERRMDSVDLRFSQFDDELSTNTQVSEEARDVALRVETNTLAIVELFNTAKWNVRIIKYVTSIGIGGGALLWLRDHIKLF